MLATTDGNHIIIRDTNLWLRVEPEASGYRITGKVRGCLVRFFIAGSDVDQICMGCPLSIGDLANIAITYALIEGDQS